jgi:putative transposase
MIKTYCFKLYERKQNKRLVYLIELAAEIYNHCIALHKRYYKLYGVYLPKNRLQAHIAKLKRLEKHRHWYDLNSQAIQEITDRIERAYTLFFRNLKRKVRTAPPSFKRRKKYKSFTMKLRGYKLLEGNAIRIGDRKYKYFKSREIEGAVKTVTVKRDKLGRLYIYFACETESACSKARTETGKIARYGFGTQAYLESLDGEHGDIETPGFFRESRREIKKLNRSFGRKQKNSKGREQVRRRLYRQQQKTANQRKDFWFKLANELCERYGVIYLSEPDRRLLRKQGGRKILSLAQSGFYGILKQQAMKYGAEVRAHKKDSS